MSDLMSKMMASGAIKEVATLSESTLFNGKTMIPTNIPIINTALSGSVTGGLTSGLTFLAGASKNFKSLLGLLMVKAYQSKYPDGIILFYDSEFGITPEYATSLKLDTDRILHIPIPHVEALKFDLSKRLEAIDRKDRVMIFIDSVGNLASKKEVEDALNEKAVADMSRAKALKSLWRIATPYFTTRDIPCVVVNHTYKEIGLFPKDIMSGGTGGMYSANQVFFISKAQEKDGNDLAGWNFTITIEKSRFVRDKSKFSFLVTWDKGIHKWSGLKDLAMEFGYVTKPKVGWYQVMDPLTGESFSDKLMREKDLMESNEIWEHLLEETDFPNQIRARYLVGNVALEGGE